MASDLRQAAEPTTHRRPEPSRATRVNSNNEINDATLDQTSDEGPGAVAQAEDPSTRMPQGGNEVSPDIQGEVINDPSDERMLLFTGLRDQALRQLREAPGGDMEGIFIAEGDVVIQRAIDAGHMMHSVIVEAARTRPLEFDIGSTPLYRMGEPVVEEIASHRRYRGAMAAFHRPGLRPLAEVVANASTVIVTEGVNNPTNRGVMLRTAAALGVQALLVDPSSCDPLARRTCRVSMGAVFAVPHTRLPEFPDGLEALHQQGFSTIALTPDPTAQPLDSIRFEPGERVALLLGAEEPGLTAATQQRATHRASIPMHQGIDSLNVATAAAIAMWHVTRARL